MQEDKYEDLLFRYRLLEEYIGIYEQATNNTERAFVKSKKESLMNGNLQEFCFGSKKDNP